ncbi:uncharacterized protein PV06_11509 [Exophiala oligosperma]|uniref:Uncharacterized protein n=1 Tax=Exophiala oligosperma TaxID=215243 RepID=A0A0D2D1W9_9EURO|nr:uncharacterized protein PV06_11509 [Exophiala oligosperma]KIW36215.1 hypothetical protein PV06_11509 [Exophiala oligosperma]
MTIPYAHSIPETGYGDDLRPGGRRISQEVINFGDSGPSYETASSAAMMAMQAMVVATWTRLK